ncbi:STELLO glycosyltransferase family protein [Dapis sp. BLCC M126]|uniref:STELLO glycosyltransferase family protein n=1 Tax=Dapis sp. BLCC M126 TaxID=3400189 RepID=UPI003CF1A2D8
METDDDNIPLDDFWQDKQPTVFVPQLSHQGWVNIYKYFTSQLIWPRGLPLNKIHDPLPELENLTKGEVFCPIQQGLADDNPDVDAIYRLILPLPLKFNNGLKIALGNRSWCPFNSQNTIWFPDAYPLLYLPAYCSFRMTDIWRSFVAQRIAWENGWSILFYSSTVYQERNEHNLMKDFQDEVIGYINNQEISDILGCLKLASGLNNIPDNMIICYSKLIELGVVGENEMKLLESWFEDLSSFSND